VRDRTNLVIGGISVALALVLLSTANRYGFHRDELYFIEAGRHLAWGYVDQPPLTPLLGRLSQAAFGSSPRALRVPSVLAGMIVVLVIASLAKHLGGTPRARILAAVCTAVAAVVLAVTHILSTTTFDLLAWVLVLWLVTRILQGADPRLWIAVGGVAGIGLLNKHLVLFLVISLAIGIVLGRRVDVLRSWWLVAGVALALVIWSPNLVWQATHGWPQLDMARAIADSDGAENRATLVPLQLLLLGPLLLRSGAAGCGGSRGAARRDACALSRGPTRSCSSPCSSARARATTSRRCSSSTSPRDASSSTDG
jgi:4-amino-4-deoxy-L-arabinose transferase-like glycosyltransferase